VLKALYLRDAKGLHFDPATYAKLKTWLNSATSTNMAYMLSAQLAAMKLNVYNNLVDGNSLIYAPGTQSAANANLSGFAKVNDVMNEANGELGAHGSTPSGSPYRAYQEKLMMALDGANNNTSFLQPGPASCPSRP
jgi:hypothetical protein